MKQTNWARLPDPRDRPTLPVWPDTGQALGLSKASTYEAVKRGDIPSLTIGRRIVIPTAALLRMLGIAETDAGPDTPQLGAA